jgi:hypothetical protein
MGVLLLTSLMALPLSAAEKKAGKPIKGDPTRWEETIKQFEASDAATPPPKGGVLLVGGSNARRWTDVSEYFPQHHVINRGFGGARLTDVLHYTDRIVLPYAPKTILLTADDPTIYLSCSLPDGEPTSRGHLLHHPRHVQVIERRCKEIGIPVTAVYASDPNRSAKTEGVVGFLLRHVDLPASGGN